MAALTVALLLGCSASPSSRTAAAPIDRANAGRHPATPLPASVPALPNDAIAGIPAAQTLRARAEFLDALRSARQAAATEQTASTDPAELRSYVLYDYLAAARLQQALQASADPALDARIDQFLTAHAGQPVAADLRHDWLVSLAARGRWDWFLPRASNVSDLLLRCQRLAGQLAQGTLADSERAAFTAEALSLWGEPVQQPSACDGAFEWLRDQGLLASARIEARVRAALTTGNVGLALQLSAGLPPVQSAPLLLWARLLQSPAPTLRLLAMHAGVPAEPQALQAGFHRLALRDSTAAAALLPALRSRGDIAPAASAQLQREAALGLAYDHDPAALTLFAALPESLADERVQQWRVRAALWSGDWPRALAWLGSMSPTLAAQPRWQYWRARATEAVQGAASAAALYAPLAASRDYYGYLAADRLHVAYNLQNQPTAEDEAAQAALAQQPGLVRARELLACGLYDDAMAEWSQALAGSSPALKIQAAHLASDWGWYAQSIGMLAAAGDWDDVKLRYPRPFEPLVSAAAERTHLPVDWILAVMRQESLFRSDAVSAANARGLMQLLPSTAQGVAQRWQVSLEPYGLFDPATAVLLGAAHLRELLDRFQGQLAPALAAYNAGSVPLSRWLPSSPMAADVWVENIPYDETRGYVQHIVEHIVAYAFTRDAELPQLATLLPPVGPAASYAASSSPPAAQAVGVR